jgi:hypothetical protein
LGGGRNIVRLRGGASTRPKDWKTTPESLSLRGRIGLTEVLLSQAKFIWTCVAGLTLWRHIGGR